MKTLALALSILTFTACGMRKPNSNAQVPPRTETQAQDLGAKDANGVSTSEFTVPDNSSKPGSYAVVTFHFNTEKYKAYTVLPPALSGKNCANDKQQPRLVRFGGGQRVFTGKGKATPRGLSVAYGVEKPSAELSDESIALFIYVPKGCTDVKGTLTVKFSNPVHDLMVAPLPL